MTDPARTADLRRYCRGVYPLTARLAPWMQQVIRDPRLFNWVQQQGSPLNILAVPPFTRSASRLQQTAHAHGLSLSPYFARKANKCLCFVDACREEGLGVDTASEAELRQCLDRGIAGRQLVCTAAIKNRELVRLCVQRGVTLVLDNRDECRLLLEELDNAPAGAGVALRLQGERNDARPWPSRFGFSGQQLVEVAAWLKQQSAGRVRVEGLQFHLEGYDAPDRAQTLQACLRLVDRLSEDGTRVQYVDIGGGLPVNYLESEAEWEAFWTAHRLAVTSDQTGLTYRNHGLGLTSAAGEAHGAHTCYPFYQQPERDDWLASVLTSTTPAGETLAQSCLQRGLSLRCEPGRALLDGCGMTIAQVVHRKQVGDDWFIGLAINGTQCRTGSADFLVDPILAPRPGVSRDATPGLRGFLMGAYCTETDAILKRRLAFPHDVVPGDLIVLPNTAGYFMHFHECRSHQFPLARNLVWSGGSGEPLPDPIDCVEYA